VGVEGCALHCAAPLGNAVVAEVKDSGDASLFCLAFHPSRGLQRDYDAAKELLTSTITTLRTALGGWGCATEGRLLVCCFVDPANVRSPLSVGPAGPSHPILGLAMNNLGFVLKEAGQRERALECYEEALHIRTK
jgi:tetratricopeptide (TPR) repeat protein